MKKIAISRVTRKILRASLLWPSNDEETNPGIKLKIKVFGFFIWTNGLTVPLTMHFLLMITKYPQVNLTEETAMIIAIYGSYYMTCAFISKQQKLIRLLRDLSNFEKFGQPANFEEENDKLDRWVKWAFYYTVVGTFIYSLIKVSEKSLCKETYEGIDYKENYCGLMVPMHLPFKTDNFLIFFVCYLYVIITANSIIKMCLLISYNVFEIVYHIVLRINHLKIMLLECFDSDDLNVCESNLRKCILYHNEIIDFATRLKDIFINCMFGHLALTSAICACLGKQIVENINAMVCSLHFMGWIAALFLGCVAGQRLFDSSDIISEALWYSNWYIADIRLKKDVIFMLMRSQKNFTLRAGPFGTLGFSLFLSIMKMSYSILCTMTS